MKKGLVRWYGMKMGYAEIVWDEAQRKKGKRGLFFVFSSGAGL
jgi:hypothetical protein